MSDGFGGKVKDFFGFGEVENYQDPYYSDGFSEEERETRREAGARDAVTREPAAERGAARSRAREDRYSSSRARSYDDYDADAPRSASAGRYESAAGSRTAASATRRPVAKPEPTVVRIAMSTYTQGSELADIIKSGDVAVFNLGGMEKGEARRVLDFAAGLSRGVDAELKKLRGVRNFVLIPPGLELEQSQLDQLVEEL